jgi:hypothetical protein
VGVGRTDVRVKAIFAIDPGPNTGIAWGIFDTTNTVRYAMTTRRHSGSATIKGKEMEQAKELFDLWQQFKEGAVREHDVAPEDVELVIEDFSLFPGGHAGGKEGVAPARIGWAFEGYRQGRAAKFRAEKHVSPAIWQLPSAMRNRKLLKKWDAWIVGKVHERSAFCHIGERLRHLIR